MSSLYRHGLPQSDGGLFLTDGGIETYLIFHRDLDLPEFAAFDLLADEAGIEELRAYYLPFLDLAAQHHLGFVLESPTWRANPRWGSKVGYEGDRLAEANRRAIELLVQLRESRESPEAVVISGCIGPHDDGYSPAEVLTPEEARAYHQTQVQTLAATAADLVSAITMTYSAEAIGIARAAKAAEMPVVISFTVETDGSLPSGQSLAAAIEEVDADDESDVAYFMVNCAHPSHLEDVLAAGGPWRDRLRGLRANASTMSHAELDVATSLDEGDPADLGERYAALRIQMPQLNVLGGCCGTDIRHVAAICRAVV